MREREVIRERPVAEDREVILDEPAPRRGGSGVVVPIIGILVVLLVGWFLLNALGILGEAAEDAEVNAPEVQVDADVDQ